VYFNQLGGHAAVELVIDTFLTNVLEDPEINGRFAVTDAAVLRGHLIDQVCQATGGYCTYTGRSMLDAHTGMNITEDEFNFLVGDLLRALDTLGVPYSEGLDGSGLADALLLALLGMKGDIVGH
jgi:hemoglobin